MGLSALPLAAQDRFRAPESREDVEDWSLECYLNQDGTPQACQAFHRVLMDNATRIALVASFAVPAEGNGVLYQIALPLGIDLTAGVLMTVDGDYSVQVPVTRCTLEGCLLEGRLTAAPYDALLTGTSASFTVRILGQGELVIPMSLAGLATSIQRISAAAKPAPPPAPPSPESATALSPNSIIDEVPDPLVTLPDDGVGLSLAPVTGVRQGD
ncbi:Invasion associated locus B [Sulfitobacter guttiformis KCTC 32187]|nr:Invasion associated locus B [Sulfitobacter guttiformis KCTC 32187]